jgi:hypothetical protein
MGCFNGTCALSNLPIHVGEKVVFIPLIKTLGTKTKFFSCGATDNFIPLGFPIIGEYNDYGGIENATTDKNNKDFLYSFNYFYETCDSDGYIEIDKSDSLSDLLNDTFCVTNSYVQLNDFSFHPNGLVEIDFMMIHYNLYQKIINEISNRIPVGWNDNYKRLYKNKFIEKLQTHWTIVEDLEEIKKLPTTDIHLSSFNDSTLKLSIDIISNEIFCQGNYLTYSLLTFFAKILLFKKDEWEIVLDKSVEQLIFTTALNYMRKGYLCNSGCGSQCNETRLHVILADFIKEHVINYAKQCDISDEDGTAETLFFFK